MFALATVAFGLNFKTLVLKTTCTSCVSNVYTLRSMISNSCYYWRECFVFLLGSVTYKEEYFWSILEVLYILHVKWQIVYWCGVIHTETVWCSSCQFFTYLLWTVIAVNLINHDVISHSAISNWSVLSVYLLMGKWSHVLLSKTKSKVCVRGWRNSEVQVKQRSWMNIGGARRGGKKMVLNTTNTTFS